MSKFEVTYRLYYFLSTIKHSLKYMMRNFVIHLKTIQVHNTQEVCVGYFNNSIVYNKELINASSLWPGSPAFRS